MATSTVRGESEKILKPPAQDGRADALGHVDTGQQYQSYILCAFVAHRSAYPRDVHDLDRRCLQHVDEAMTVGWHPDLRRLLAESDPDSVMLVQHQASVPVPAWQSIYEVEMRASGNAAVRTALHAEPVNSTPPAFPVPSDISPVEFTAPTRCEGVAELDAERDGSRPRTTRSVNETRLSV